MIKVLLADDHALMRDSLRHILESAGGFEVVGEASDCQATIAMVRSIVADVALIDLSMPGLSGFELIGQLKKERPSLRTLVVTMHTGPLNAARAFRAGASGYLTKESASRELISAVTKIASGVAYMSTAIAERLAQNLNEPIETMPHQRLTDREFEIFRGIVEGKSMTEIADELHLSVKTVSSHKTHIIEKMEIPNESGLIRYAIRERLFEDPGAG
ncbi:response regulator transcription factor [Paraburkholderia mimosarum]|uniref:response regulator n=1 Tax=Paraburkholderia mimosarum TaxID=312026 RepID=UPI00041CE7F1|nr:response regulator transcription factor [Paraburkholderia mimosarum]